MDSNSASSSSSVSLLLLLMSLLVADTDKGRMLLDDADGAWNGGNDIDGRR